MTAEEEGKYSGIHTIQFTEKAWYEGCWEYCKWIPSQLGEFATVVISLWAVAEVLSSASDRSVPIEDLAFPVLSCAVVISLYRAYVAKMNYVPETLVGESRATKRIFRKQDCGWNLALAQQMLRERLKAADDSLLRIDKESEFIEPRQLDYEDYVAWLQTRPEMILRMVRSAAVICTQDLPDAIGNTTEEQDLAALQREVDALGMLYESARKAEADWHQVVPPDEFREIHEMAYGWTSTIRNGVHRFLEILDELANVDQRALKEGTASLPALNIVFEEPDNLAEFSHRLDQIIT